MIVSVDEIETISQEIARDVVRETIRTLHAAGWRPPLRRIETAEELDALPEYAIVVDVDYGHEAAQKRGERWYDCVFGQAFEAQDFISFGPPAVVYEPNDKIARTTKVSKR